MVLASLPLTIFGWAVIMWAVVDLLMNIWRALTDLDNREAGIEYCSLAELGRNLPPSGGFSWPSIPSSRLPSSA